MTQWVKNKIQYSGLEDYLSRISGIPTEQLMRQPVEDYRNFRDMEKATRLILQTAKEDAKRITLIGDFDADGLNATAILFKLFTIVGTNEPTAIIPSRYAEEVGLSSEIVAKIAPESLVIMLDSGIGEAKNVARLKKEKRCSVIIIDHHLPGETLPDADAIIGPYDGREHEQYSTSGLAFHLFHSALDQYMMDNPFATSKIHPHIVEDVNLHAAIGTIADGQPLTCTNRFIARRALLLAFGDKSKGCTPFCQLLVFYVGVTRAKHEVEIMAARSLYGKNYSVSTFCGGYPQRDAKGKQYSDVTPDVLIHGSKPEEEPPKQTAKLNLRIGQRVSHQFFGYGTVTDLPGSGNVEILFDYGGAKRFYLPDLEKKNLLEV